ncbi:pygopus homolog 1 [Pleurodeles waltl]|uniref:pygopus homolog 1 n=1 Tax=Pleurodeles waltl TaxID=8319 RepID=UPI0037097D4A
MSGSADGGLEWFGRADFQIGSPDRKRRKNNAQGSSFSPLSEYAPPLNPSSDHLVAANPFDDHYNPPPNRLCLSTNSYFRFPGYVGFGGVRRPTDTTARILNPLSRPYSNRNRIPQLSQNSLEMGVSQCYNFSSSLYNQPGFGKHTVSKSSISQNVHLLNQPLQHSNCENFDNIMEQTYPSQFFNSVMSSVPRMNPHFHIRLEPKYTSVYSEIAEEAPKSSSQRHHFCDGNYKNSNCNSNAIAPEHITNESNDHFKNVNRQKITNELDILSNNAGCINDVHANETVLPPGRESTGASSKESIKTSLHTKPSTNPFLGSACVCGICRDEVSDNEDSLLCEVSCYNWFHRICAGMTENAYSLLAAEASAVWGCDACMVKEDVPLMLIKHIQALPILHNNGHD